MKYITFNQALILVRRLSLIAQQDCPYGTRFEYIFYNGALQVKTPLLFVLFEYETSSAEQLGSKGIYDNYDGYYPTKQKIV